MSDDTNMPLSPRNGREAQRQSMWKLKRAVLKRKEHAAHAALWRAADTRNHFGPSIEAAMRLGRIDDGH